MEEITPFDVCGFPAPINISTGEDPAVVAFRAYEQVLRRWEEAQDQLDALFKLLPEDIRCGPRVIIGREGVPGAPGSEKPIFASSEDDILHSRWPWLRRDGELRAAKLAAFQLERVRVKVALRRAGVSEMQEQVNSLYIDLEDAEEEVARQTATTLAGLLGQARVLHANLGHEEGLDRRLSEQMIASLERLAGRRR